MIVRDDQEVVEYIHSVLSFMNYSQGGIGLLSDRGDGLCWTIGALTVFAAPLALFAVSRYQRILHGNDQAGKRKR